jgi:MFS family permease
MTFLCVLSFLTYFDRVCITRAQKDIQRDLQITDPQMGLIFAAFWLAYALFELPGGWMGDRFGPRVTLTRIVLAWSLFTALSGSAWGFASLFLFRLLFGAGEAGAYPNMANVQARWLPARSRGRAGGLLWLLARLGGALSPLLFGLMLRFFDSPDVRSVLDSFLPGEISSWRLGFWTAGVCGLVWCVAFYAWFRDDPARMPSVNAAELRLIQRDAAPAKPGHRMPRSAWRALLRCRSLWAMGLLYICTSFGWSFNVSWIARYYEEVHGVSFENSELRSGLPLFFGGISCLVGGTISDALVRWTGRKWLGRAVLPIGGHVLASLAVLAVPLTSTPDEATALMCVAAACADLGQGANWATIVDLGGIYAGTAAGFINMVGNSGNWIQPYVGSLIFHAWGWDNLFRVYAIAFLAAATMWFFIDPRRPFYGEDKVETF